MSGRYSIAFLGGHGIGPEVTAEASRAVSAAARLHGFTVDEHHVPFGADAFVRFGHPFPGSSRRAVLGADAVLVGPGVHPRDALETELDVRASMTRLRFAGGELSVLSPADAGAWDWTLRRAVRTACASRARLALVGATPRLADAPAGLEVERLGAPEAIRALVLEPRRFDVVVCPPELGSAAAEVAACTADGRLAAWGRLAENGPGVFGAGFDPEQEVAGQGVADPRPLLLATALLLGEGLGERSAAAGLAQAIGRTNGGTRSTRGVGDDVLAELPLGLGVEFLREAV